MMDLALVPDPDLIRFSVLLFSRDESESYLAGLGTVGMEVLDQVPKLDAVVVPAAGQYGLLVSTAAAIKHLNSRVLVIVSRTMWHLDPLCTGSAENTNTISFYFHYFFNLVSLDWAYGFMCQILKLCF